MHPILLLASFLMACRSSMPAVPLGEQVSAPKDSTIRLDAEPTLLIHHLGVGYAHLTDGGNLADARLRVTFQNQTQTVRLFRESSDDPQAVSEIGPYRIVLLSVSAHQTGTAFLRIEKK